MKERLAVWGPLSIVKRSLELGCTNVISRNAIDLSLTGKRKMAPPTAGEMRRMLAAGGWW